MRHLRASESRTAVDVWYLGPDDVLEYRMVRTSAEFCIARKVRQPYRKILPLLRVDIAVMGRLPNMSSMQ